MRQHRRLLVAAILIFALSICAGCMDRPPHLVPNATATPIEAPDYGITNTTHTLRVTVLDVGQGDAILVQTPNDKTMLVDAGDTDAGPVILSGLKNRGVAALDVGVVSHPHADHIGGWKTVLSQVPVYTFCDAGYPATTKTYETMLSTIDAKDIRYVTPTAGQTIEIDPEVRVTVLSPDGRNAGDIHDNMLVLRLEYGETSFVLTGDMNEDLEGDLAWAPATVLKVGHHGSSTSTSAGFLAQTKPSVAVISVGTGNSYGHPTAAALGRLAASGAIVYRTDRDGDITVTSDGRRCAVTTG